MLREREHTQVLCGEAVIDQWQKEGGVVGLERGEDEQAVRGGGANDGDDRRPDCGGDPSGHGSAPGDDRPPEGGQTELRPTQIWGFQFTLTHTPSPQHMRPIQSA